MLELSTGTELQSQYDFPEPVSIVIQKHAPN